MLFNVNKFTTVFFIILFTRIFGKVTESQLSKHDIFMQINNIILQKMFNSFKNKSSISGLISC